MSLQTPTPTESYRPATFSSFVQYAFFKLDPEWRRLSPGEREASKHDFLSTLKTEAEQVSPRTYSLVGTRSNVDFMLWTIADRLEKFQEFQSRLLKTSLGKFLSTPYSYLAMFRPSEYFGRSRDPEPVGSKYLFVYPFTKKREWYGLPFEERRRMMRDHVEIGHKHSSVAIHTAYSFGLDDYEFILSFETDHPQDFLNLVMELRTSEASKYTALEIPIFTCISTGSEKMLDLLGP